MSARTGTQWRWVSVVALASAFAADRDARRLRIGQSTFSLPSFPFAGCGVHGKGLSAAASAPGNTDDLRYGDGVLAG
jgi:hypothetical protein